MSFGVIFDIDGTLIDSHETHVDCWVRFAAQKGISVNRDRINQTFGMVNREVVQTFCPGDFSEAELAEMADIKEAMVRDEYRRSFPAMPGSTALLRTLHEHGFRLAVGSSGPKENVDLVCELLGVTSILGARISADDVEHGKPNPEVFLTAAKRIGVPAQNCIVVEDATVGIKAAHAGGMKCIAILSTGHAESELKDADRRIRRLEEITPAMVCELLNISPNDLATSAVA